MLSNPLSKFPTYAAASRLTKIPLGAAVRQISRIDNIGMSTN
jgi:hypothetical protein